MDGRFDSGRWVVVQNSPHLLVIGEGKRHTTHRLLNDNQALRQRFTELQARSHLLEGEFSQRDHRIKSLEFTSPTSNDDSPTPSAAKLA
jgi:hypothetical protein